MKSFVMDDLNAFWIHNSREKEDDELIEDLKQAGIDSSKQLPKSIIAQLGGTAGFVEAQSELFEEYSGLPNRVAKKVRDEIATSLTQPQGWSTDSIVERIKHFWEDAGFDPEVAEQRAANVARTEVRSIASEFKRRNWREEEKDRGEQFKYHIRGASDHRTTKLSYWSREQVPKNGLTLDKMEEMLDEGVRLARTGAFWHGGELEGTPGKHMKLPSNFRRRGFLIHFGDRDQVFRIA